MPKGQKGVSSQNKPKLTTKEKEKRKSDKKKAKELAETGPIVPGRR